MDQAGPDGVAATIAEDVFLGALGGLIGKIGIAAGGAFLFGATPPGAVLVIVGVIAAGAVSVFSQSISDYLLGDDVLEDFFGDVINRWIQEPGYVSQLDEQQVFFYEIFKNAFEVEHARSIIEGAFAQTIKKIIFGGGEGTDSDDVVFIQKNNDPINFFTDSEGDVVIARWYFLDSRLTAGYNIGLTHGDHHANIDARPSAAAA